LDPPFPAADLQEPTKAVAPRGGGAPPREYARFLERLAHAGENAVLEQRRKPGSNLAGIALAP
jgi:hypothetical protein